LARTQAVDYEQRKEVIVEKSAELFAQLGFNVASVANIAKACNTSKSLIYHYYPSKEDILYAVMSSHIDQLIEDVDDALAVGGLPISKLQALLHAFMSHYVGAADRQKVLLNELGNLPDAAKKTIIGKQRKVIDAVQALIVELYPELAKSSARARAQTMLLFGMINWTHTWFDPSGPLSADEIADMALALIRPR
jgi:AcrR family transcriptional regulator